MIKKNPYSKELDICEWPRSALNAVHVLGHPHDTEKTVLRSDDPGSMVPWFRSRGLIYKMLRTNLILQSFLKVHKCIFLNNNPLISHLTLTTCTQYKHIKTVRECCRPSFLMRVGHDCSSTFIRDYMQHNSTTQLWHIQIVKATGLHWTHCNGYESSLWTQTYT